MTRARAVCVVGSINMDMVSRAPRFPAVGETILGGTFVTCAGGKGANQAVAAARMGATVRMIGRVGDDAWGKAMRRTLVENGVDVSCVGETRGVSTGVAAITVVEGGGNTIVVSPGANGEVSVEDVERARGVMGSCDVVLMQLEVPIETVEQAARVAKGMGKVVILNAAPARELTRELLGMVDVLIVNETEAAVVSGDPGYVGAVERGGAGTLAGGVTVVTLGERGAVCVGRDGVVRAGAIDVQAVDTVGAGDAFCGAVASVWGTVSVERALRVGCVAGGLATTKRGAVDSLPTLDEVERWG